MNDVFGGNNNPNNINFNSNLDQGNDNFNSNQFINNRNTGNRTNPQSQNNKNQNRGQNHNNNNPNMRQNYQNIPPQGNQGNRRAIGNAFNDLKSGIGLDKKIGLNEILLAPINSLYKFMMKMQTGFKLDEEVRVLIKIQVLYLALGVVTGKSLYLILTIGNILSIFFVLILASSYVDLPDYLKPGGIINNLSNRNNIDYQDEYNEAYNNQFQNNSYRREDNNQNNINYTNYQEQMNGFGPDYNQVENPSLGNPENAFNSNSIDNFDNKIKFNESNLESTIPGGVDVGYERDSNTNNLGSDMYNPENSDGNPFNTAGLNTEKNSNEGVYFGFNNLSGVSDEARTTNKLDNLDSKTNKDFDINEMFKKSVNSQFSPNLDNIYRNPKNSRSQLFEKSPLKDKVVSDRKNFNRQMEMMSPPPNKPVKQNIVQKGSKNLLNMVKDGYIASMVNSNLHKQDEGYELV